MFSNLRNIFPNVLAGNKIPVIAACQAIILVSGSVGNGLILDDYAQRNMLLNPARYAGRHHAINILFVFIPRIVTPRAIASGALPWWTHPGLHWAFWRPLAAATHWLDYHLWPQHPAIMHIHSLFWFGAMVLMAAMLYRRMMTPLWAAGLAALLFAIDDAHGTPAGFLANRNALMAAMFGFLAIYFHHRWRKEGWKLGAILAPLGFLAGLLSAEIGLSAGGYLLSYELFKDHRLVPFLPPKIGQTVRLEGIPWLQFFKPFE